MKEMNSWWMYAIAIFVTIFILVGALYFVIKAWKRGKAIGMPKETLKKAMISSAVFSIAPSIGIFIGVITLSGVLGIPLPWIRLSVIGALHYEIMAFSTATSELGGIMTPEIFVTVAIIMTLGIIWGCLVCLFLFKKYQKRVAKATTNKENRWSSKILFNAVFIGIVCAFAGQAFAYLIPFSKKVFNSETGEYIASMTKSTYVPIVVLFVSFGCMFLFDILIKKCKQKWLENFSLSFSMIIAMTVAVLLGLGGIL